MGPEVGYQLVSMDEDETNVEEEVVQTVLVEVESSPPPPKRLTLPKNPPASAQGQLDWRQQRLNTQLLCAAVGGNLDDVKRALREGANVNSVCRDTGLSACHIAAYFGQTDILQNLLDAGAELRRDFDGAHPVHLAVWHGHVKILKLLVKNGTNGKMAKMVKNDVDVRVEPSPIPNLDPSLLDSWDHDHSEINESTRLSPLSLGATALHMASQWVDLQCVELLLRAGASCNVRDARDLTPLDVVGELANVQVTSQSQPHSTDHSTSSSITSEAADLPTNPRSQRSQVREFTDGDMQEIINLMITRRSELGCDANEDLKSEKMTPLHTAVLRGNLSAVTTFLKYNFDATILNEEGLAPIHLAVQEKNLKVLTAILSEETRRQKVINFKNGKGFTPLHIAVLEVWVSGIYLLLEAGADLMATTSFEGNTVLHLAAQKRNAMLLDQLLRIPMTTMIVNAKNSTHHTALMISVISNDKDSIKTLLDYKADILCVLPSNTTILHLATLHSSSDILEFLLSQYVPLLRSIISAREAKTGIVPLHVAALRGSAACVDCLLRHGADVMAHTAREPYHCGNALHLAARKGRVEVVKVLLEHDKNLVASINALGWYPLHIAARYRHRRCVEEIMLSGGNLAVSVRDIKNYSWTAFEILQWSFPQPAKIIRNVLDAAISSNGIPWNHPQCKVKLQYSVLFPSTTKTHSSGTQMSMLMGVLNANDEELTEGVLLHPLVETFLHLKWKKLCGIFWLFLIIHSLFTVSLTASAILGKPPNDAYNGACFNKTNAHNATGGSSEINSKQSLSSLCTFFQYCTHVTLCMCLVKEFLHTCQKDRYYWLTLDSWLKWCLLVITTYYLYSDYILKDWIHYPERQKYKKHAVSFAILLAWINLLTLFSRLPRWGLHILMFLSVTRNFIKVCCAFWVLFFGFTFAFMIQFDETGSLSCLWKRLVRVIVMTSELDYGGLFPEGSPGNTAFGRIIFLIFIVLVTVVLMNLLVGLAVSDITTLQINSKTALLSKQVDFLNLIEGPLFFESLQYWTPKKINDWIQKKVSVPKLLEVGPGNARFESWPRHLKESILRKHYSVRSAGSKKKATDVIDPSSCKLESDFGDTSDEEDAKDQHKIKAKLLGIEEKMDTELHKINTKLLTIEEKIDIESRIKFN